MTWVKSRLLRPDGSPVVGQCVTATLKTRPSWLTNHSGQVIGQVRVNTDTTGQWRLDLLPYTEFETSDYAYYELNEGRGMPTWLIRVPPPTVPPVDVWMRNILISAPPVPQDPWMPITTLGMLHNIDVGADSASDGYVLGTSGEGQWGLVPNALPGLLDVDEESLAGARPGDALVMLPSGKWGVSAGPFHLAVEWAADPDDASAIFLTVHGGTSRGARVLWGDKSSPTDVPPEEPVRHVYPKPGVYTVVARDKALPTVNGTAAITIQENAPTHMPAESDGDHGQL